MTEQETCEFCGTDEARLDYFGDSEGRTLLLCDSCGEFATVSADAAPQIEEAARAIAAERALAVQCFKVWRTPNGGTVIVRSTRGGVITGWAIPGSRQFNSPAGKRIHKKISSGHYTPATPEYAAAVLLAEGIVA